MAVKPPEVSDRRLVRRTASASSTADAPSSRRCQRSARLSSDSVSRTGSFLFLAVQRHSPAVVARMLRLGHACVAEGHHHAHAKVQSVRAELPRVRFCREDLRRAQQHAPHHDCSHEARGAHRCDLPVIRVHVAPSRPPVCDAVAALALRHYPVQLRLAGGVDLVGLGHEDVEDE
eukprot:scaffold84862_cov76-Phaeocystis_antarctica.AAC.1